MKKIFTLCVVLCLSYLTMGASTPKHEFRATWLATVSGIDWPKTKATNDATREQQKQELIDILDKMKAGNLNAVCFQVRSLCDAMYQSSYEPWSIALTGTRGKDPGYDPLQFAIDEAHKRGMELHVWVNPFRASTSTLAATDMLWDNAGDWLIKYNNSSFSGYLIDPGYPESRAYVVKVLMEIINNYDVDGLVMDDYFYAYGGTTNQDSVAQALHYRASEVIDVNNNGNKIDDWRRSNVDNVIKAMYDSIQVVKPWVRFGMGPGGIWSMDKNAAEAYGLTLPSGIRGSDPYTELYCNTVEWIKQGWVDYVNPQIYWSTQVTAQDYDVLCQWWSKDVCEHFSNLLPNGKKVHHFPSPAAYKVYGDYLGYEDGVEEMKREMDANRKNLSSGYTGAVFYNTTSYLQMSEELAESHFTHTALAPPMEWKVKGDLAAPTNLQLSGTTLSWQHPTAERFTVYAYPKGIGVNTATSNPQYLQAVVYDKSFNTSSLGSLDDITIAVYTYDRYGVEHGVALYNADPNATDDPEPEPEPEPEPSNTITWELNGGEVNTVTVEVPTQSGLMLQFMNDYVAYFGTPTIDVDAFHPTGNMTGFLYRGKNTREKSVNEMILDETAGWKWLADYIISTSASNPTIVAALNSGTEVNWRYSIAAFFEQNGSGTYNVDFSTAGQPAAWGSTYQVAHGMVLLPTYVTSAYTLPTPTHPEGLTFLGWYDNPAFSGSSLTIIPAHWTGTLYAQWQENTPTIDPTWQITYTSSNDSIVTPYATDVFGANIVSNTYQDGQGVITFDGPVTCIGNWAFSWCHSLASITIPNSVTSIGSPAFYGCSSLASMVVESGNTTYDSRENCNAIIETATNTLIAGCPNTIIPNSVTSIGSSAFHGCSFLTSVTIPNSVTSIGKAAFSVCSSLTSVTIPNSVTSIGTSAFYGCSSLTSITIPNSVTSIGDDAFYGCSSLTSIVVAEGNTIYDSRNNCNAIIETATNSLIAGCQNTIIPNSVTSIGDHAFDNCTSLTSITIPNSVTSIGGSAFSSCSSLTSITIPNTVTSIGERAFAYCSSLYTIRVETTTPPTLGEDVFYKTPSPVCVIPCGTLAAYESSDWVQYVSEFIEEGCLKITYELNGGMMNEFGWTSKDDMFQACMADCGVTTLPSLDEIKALGNDNALTTICAKLTDVSGMLNSDKWEWLEQYIMEVQNAQAGNVVGSSFVPAITTTSDAVYWRYALAAFFVDGQRTAWPYSADFSKAGKDEAYIPTWRHAFDNPTNPAEEFVLNAPYKEGYTFAGWYTTPDFSSEKVTTVNSETTGTLYAKWIDDTWVIKYTSTDGNIVEPYATDVFGANIVSNTYEDGVGTITFDGPVTSIGDYAFHGCSGLTSITIPNSVTSIGYGALAYCSGLTSITIPNSVTSIGYCAFEGCFGLTSITIPNSVTSIGVGAFFVCSSLTSITIPNSVTSIGDRAFYGCSSLTSIVVEGENMTYDSRENCNAIIETATNTLIAGCKNTIIPNSVTSIGDLAFYECSSLTSITIPNSVTSIGDGAFFVCSSLTSITIPNSVTSIGDLAFEGCFKLKTLHVEATTPPILGTSAFTSSPTCYIPCGTLSAYQSSDWASQVGSFVEDCVEGQQIFYTSTDGNIVTPYKTNVFGANIVSNTYENGVGTITFDGPVTSIGENAFRQCSSIASITIPKSVKSIGEYAFSQCSYLSSITIPDSVTRIGDWAFSFCMTLTSVTIHDSVTSIGEGAFWHCNSLTSITIPSSVTNIGYGVFGYCYNLASLVIEEGNTIYDSRDNCNAIIETTTNTLISGCQNTIILNNVTSIGAEAFYGCSSLTSIILPNSVTNIGEQAFANCSGLTSITLPNSVMNIGDQAFVHCSRLDSITLPNSVTSIGEMAFLYCSSLDTIHVEATTPPALEDSTVFMNTPAPICVIPCGTLAAYEVSDWASQVGSFVEDCVEGQQIYYTSTDGNIVTPTQADVFGANIVSNTYKDGQGVITFDGPVTSIGDSAFYYCTSLASITIPESVTSIGEEAFWSCESLTSITIPKSVTSIGAYAFSNCRSITSITIPNSVTSIGEAAFSRCSSLTSVTIPESVMSIGYHAFFDCESLTSITIPESVTSIGEEAFAACSSLTSIVVEPGNTTYDSRENCNAIIETATNTLIAGCQNTVIPNTVTSIGNLAFFYCKSLTSATIGSGVTSIGNRAFEGCSSLASITIPNSVTSIGENAFSGCTSLTSVTLGSGVTSIRFATFSRCSSLTSVTLGSGVTSIEVWAFGDCTALTSITCEAITPPALDTNVFTSSPTCYIPCGTLSAYQASDWASQVSEFVEEDCAPVQQCGDNLFWEYADGVLTITGSGDMYDYAVDTDVPWYDVRDNIKTINMSDEMTKIGDYAFYKCTALTSVTLPEQLKHIGNRAFAQDTKIAGNIVIPEGVNYIEERAFFNLTGVSQFQVLATTPPTLESTNVFTNVNAPIIIPCGYGLVYRKANIWKDLNLSTCEVLIDNLYYMPVGDNVAYIIGYDNKPAGTLTIPGSVVIGSKTRTVTTLADSLFFDCKEISSVIFNEGLESIGERAFVRCGLTGTIVLPSTLTTIGERAFSYCDNVEKYILQAMTPPALANDVFTGSNSKALFYISCEAMDDYKVATNWSSLKSRLRDACLNIYHYNTALGANGVHATEDTLVASIYYRRKFTPYRWETLYLPFEVDRVTVLEDGLEYDLTAWDIVYGGHYFLAKPDGMLNKEILFGFTDELESHTPYIIQFSDAYYTDKLITFYGKESWNKLSTSFEVLSSSAWMQIAGNTTLQDQLLEKPVYMLRSGLDFILQKTTTTLHPFECYVMPYATPSGTPARMNVRFRGDVPTAVESVKGNEFHLTYSVDGYTLTVYPQGQAFSIYSLNGALIYSCEAGKEAVDCELNSGCYLLHAGAEAHKIML